jgi:hypothetical protein
MSYDFRDPNKADADSATLQIEVPHWAARVRLYNDLHQLVGNFSSLEQKSDSPSIYGAQATLTPGIYEVEAELEGRVERKVVALRAKRPKRIKWDEWKSLKLAAVAPRASSVTSYEPHTAAAEEWSRNSTWPASQGTSRLFIFVRTTKPDRHKSFAKGLYLLDASGNTITDFSDTTKKDYETGWMAFNASLSPGCYILKRKRPDASLHCIPLYLCPGWETQVFVPARSAPSLRSLTVNLARYGSGYRPDDEAASAAETVLESLRSGARGKYLVASEKLTTLLRSKFANPWLGILGAHVLLRSGAKDPLAISTVDPDPELSSLFAEVIGNLRSFEGLTDHPDVRALQLELERPATTPFAHPPLLQAGLERVQHHSLNWTKTIPYRSLTDCILDNVLANSVWTAWRMFDQTPFEWNDTSTTAEPTPKKSIDHTMSDNSFAYSVVRTPITKAPVYRFVQDTSVAANETAQNPSVEIDPAVPNPLFRVALLQTVTDIINNPGSCELPDVIGLNGPQVFESLMDSIEPKVVSQTLNIPLSRVEYGLEFIRDVAAKLTSSDAELHLESTFNSTTRELLDYVLTSVVGRTHASPKAMGAPANTDVSAAPTVHEALNIAPQTIEESINKLLSEAAGLAATKTRQDNLSGEHTELSLKLSGRLQAVANELLKYAEFVVVADDKPQMLYGNAAFTKLLAQPYGLTIPPLTRRVEAQEETTKLRKICEKAWVDLLAASPLGMSVVHSPLPGMLFDDWDLQRTKIEDESMHSTTAFLNVLRGKDAPSSSRTINQEISKLLPALSLYAVSFGHGNQEQSTADASRLEQLVTQLEQIVSLRTVDAHNPCA